MREIKFRAWHKRNKSMCEVFELDLDDQEYGIAGGLCWGKSGKQVNFMPEDVELMQFTGFLDRHGILIYEGDIVKHLPDGIVNEVAYTDFSPSFRIYPTGNNSNAEQALSEEDWDSLGDGGNENFEVIGNIYSNPELLKEKNELKKKGNK